MINILSLEGIKTIPIDVFLEDFKLAYDIDDEWEAVDRISASGLFSEEFVPISEPILIGGFLMVPIHIMDEISV